MKYDWVDFYEEFANRLLAYKNKRKELLEMIKKVFYNINMEVPKIEEDYSLIDIDPFTVFGFFNKSKQKVEDRKKIINSIKEVFECKSKTPADFHGVPSVFIKKAAFFTFEKGRKADDIDNLWDVFEKALDYSKGKNERNYNSFCEALNKVLPIKEIGVAKITTGLYWIVPNDYISLDSRTVLYIYSFNNLSKEIKERLLRITKNKKNFLAEDYLLVINKIKEYLKDNSNSIKSFTDLSFEAYSYVEERKRNEGGIIKFDNIVNNKSNNKLLPIKNINDKLELIDENCERNMIFYGAPGCGKSYRIQRIVEMNKDNIGESKRILFHPDYSYSDFIGQLQPTIKNNKPTYEFIPGPFIELLKKAIMNRYNNYVLIIDEINRGNAPAVFGDVFQLLDRKKNGESEYVIKNSLISEKIYGEGNKEIDIYLPNNFYVFATMNTSDQNVFTLDTAFKRRWYFEKISNKIKPKDEENDYTFRLGEKKIDHININWKEFQEKINLVLEKKLSEYGVDGEDKQLGKYFVTESDLNNVKKFAYKVLMYLWDDAVKVDRTILFKDDYKSLDKVIEEFVGEKGMNVFNLTEGDVNNG